jgi:hypothetical protein
MATLRLLHSPNPDPTRPGAADVQDGGQQRREDSSAQGPANPAIIELARVLARSLARAHHAEAEAAAMRDGRPGRD